MKQVTVFFYPKGDSETLLRKAAARYTGMDTALWSISRGESGKPFFPEHPQVHFSISHSGDYWACAFCDETVGFDIQIREPRAFEKIAERFFARGERDLLAEEKYEEKTFYRLWTAKESYVKYTGRGFLGVLEDFDVTKPLPEDARLQWISCPEGYSACLCTHGMCSVQIMQ